jgi:hypothetical protein
MPRWLFALMIDDRLVVLGQDFTVTVMSDNRHRAAVGAECRGLFG